MLIPRNIVGLDYETFFDSKAKYSLKAKDISMTEYIRDPKFKAHLVGFRTNTMATAKWVEHEEIPDLLESIDWDDTGLLAHNAHFDGLITSHHYGIIPAFYFDTLSMARVLFAHDIGASLDEVARYLGFSGKTKIDALKATNGTYDLPEELLEPLGEYCKDDVNDMWEIFHKIIKNVPQEELQLIHLTINAYANPRLHVDIPRAQAELDREVKKRRDAILSCSEFFDLSVIKDKDGETTYEKTLKALGKNDLVIQALKNVGAKPPMKWSEKQQKEIPAFAKTDLEFKELLEHSDNRIKTLAYARQITKSTIGETRARRLISHGSTGNLPIALNYGKAHTLRWTGGDKMNAQNFTRGGELRKSIIPPPGYKLIIADSSQIEARTNAWLSDQDDMLDIFRNGEDPYADLASTVYGFPINKIDHPRERFLGKTAVLGLGYQMGAPKFRLTLAQGIMGPPTDISTEEAKRIVDTYRNKNRYIKLMWERGEGILNDMMHGYSNTWKCISWGSDEVEEETYGYINLPNGLQLHYPNLDGEWNNHYDQYQEYSYRNTRKTRTHIFGGKLIENIVQCLARIVVAEQVLTIAERYPEIVLLVHDEVVFLVEEHAAERAFEYALHCLRTPPKWCDDLPVDAEGGISDCYDK